MDVICAVQHSIWLGDSYIMVVHLIILGIFMSINKSEYKVLFNVSARFYIRFI